MFILYIMSRFSAILLPGSSIHGIFQARVLEWGAIAFPDTEQEEKGKECLHYLSGSRSSASLTRAMTYGRKKKTDQAFLQMLGHFDYFALKLCQQLGEPVCLKSWASP